MARNLTGDRIHEWINDAGASSFAEIRAFATGLLADHDAVVAGLAKPWSSRPVEGHVNYIKTIKRQMYGRAKLNLLRKRILMTPKDPRMRSRKVGQSRFSDALDNGPRLR